VSPTTTAILKRCPCPSHVGRRSLPLAAEHWHRNNRKKGGWAGYCKKCSGAAIRKTKANNPEKYTPAYRVAASRKTRENNPEKYTPAYDSAATRKTKANNPEKYTPVYNSAAYRKTRENNPEKYTRAYDSAASRKMRENNPEKYTPAYDSAAHRKRREDPEVRAKDSQNATARLMFQLRATPTWAKPGTEGARLIGAVYSARDCLATKLGVSNSHLAVDHFFPVQPAKVLWPNGKLERPFTGLHVHYNLRVPPVKENGAKGNKLPWSFYGLRTFARIQAQLNRGVHGLVGKLPA
jgi:hypothetical protein